MSIWGWQEKFGREGRLNCQFKDKILAAGYLPLANESVEVMISNKQLAAGERKPIL